MDRVCTQEGASAGQPFRDLNHNGRLDPYEDARLPIEERVADLLAQMTLEEKAGMLFHMLAPLDGDQGTPPGLASGTALLTERFITHINPLGSASPAEMAAWHNRLQAVAEGTRLGIPVTLSTDPRHTSSHTPGASSQAGAFSLWPEPLGLAATRDAALVQEFASIARREYRAVGLHLALHPMADLATEPRWARINGTFGEDAHLAAEMVGAYIRGFQGPELGPESVACMTKHFPGGGPQKDGEDPHFPYGREQVYPGDNVAYHLLPFEAAFAAGTAQVMPYYGMPIGTAFEEVGFGFNRSVVTGLLRERYGFDGVVCTDWGLLTDVTLFGKAFPARAWGVEHLDQAERVLKALDAGVDQFGGEACPQVISDLVRAGRLAEERLDVSVRRLLRDKFRLGLFDAPYVDPAVAETIVGNARFREAGALAQRRAVVLLKNGTHPGQEVLPLRGRPRIYLDNVAHEAAESYGTVVANPAAADLAIVRLQAPYEPRDTYPLESFFHAGDLRFGTAKLTRLLALMTRLPTIVVIYLDRPAVIPEIAEHCAALLADFGASDAAVLDIVFGRFAPTGRLPFELPSSMEAVRAQKEDLPYDSNAPLFAFGHGLTYAGSQHSAAPQA